MPAWTMTDFGPRYYPGTRDAYDVPLGDVQPGDVIERDEAPDQHWAPYGGEPPRKDPEPSRETPETTPAGQPGSEEN